jgi:hypothetical protein
MLASSKTNYAKPAIIPSGFKSQIMNESNSFFSTRRLPVNEVAA